MLQPDRRTTGRRRIVAATIVGGALLGVAVVASAAGAASGPHKITLCHATDSVTNPYVSITVDYHSTIKAGHGAHDGPVYVAGMEGRWGDIIPAFDFGDGNAFEGQNLENGGQGLLDAGCVGTVETTTTTISA